MGQIVIVINTKLSIYLLKKGKKDSFYEQQAI